MKRPIDWPILGLAFLVVLMLCLVAFAIALRNVWLIILFLTLAGLIMGYGLSLKKKREEQGE